MTDFKTPYLATSWVRVNGWHKRLRIGSSGCLYELGIFGRSGVHHERRLDALQCVRVY